MEKHKVIFGERSRYCIEVVRTRFGTIQYFVSDAETIDEITDLPAVIRQSDTINEALKGFSEKDRNYVLDRMGMPEWKP